MSYLNDELKDYNAFENEKPLILSDYEYHIHLKDLDTTLFPIIRDFKIKLKDLGKYLGEHLYFFSSKYGILASFSWWDHVGKNIREMSIENIPLGDIENPFDDLEQGWQILIWEKEECVFIMEGREPCCTQFTSWFKVEKEKYLEEWKGIIDYYKSK